MSIDSDLVVLLDDLGNRVGTTARSSVHTHQTPLHLAFSCYLRNRSGEVLITRRALTKKTWPGVWTNSCCGHPRPEETFEDAVQRRVGDELGARATGIELVDPDFRYVAVDPSGIIENELCPVYLATLDGDIDPRPEEVMDSRWIGWSDLQTLTQVAPFLLSPWSVSQIKRLVDLGALG